VLRLITRPVRAGEASNKYASGWANTCVGGRILPAWQTRLAFSLTWTNGFVTACEPFTSSTGNGARPSTANCVLGASPSTQRRRSQPTAGAGGRTRRTHQRGLSHQLLRPTGCPPAGRVTSTSRTARCGPARRVVWQGSSKIIRGPYADCGHQHRRLQVAAKPRGTWFSRADRADSPTGKRPGRNCHATE